jgi:hypothetical protein
MEMDPKFKDENSALKFLAKIEFRKIDPRVTTKAGRRCRMPR